MYGITLEYVCFYIRRICLFAHIVYCFIDGLLSLGIMLAENFNTFVAAILAIRASRRLHQDLLNSMLGAPLRFFEVRLFIKTVC